MRLVARPIDQWPGELTDNMSRTPTRFEASWRSTVELLEREVGMLDPYADEVVVQLALRERDCRLDGWMRADSKPAHPGVIVSFKTRQYGPLRYHTDEFREAGYGGNRFLTGWQSNVRAVALGLEALRKVDRYGIAKAGEQYRGWQALPPGGIALGETNMTVDEAARILWAAADCGLPPDHPTADDVATIYRAAARRSHPDAGGDPALFRRITVARDLILAHA